MSALIQLHAVHLLCRTLYAGAGASMCAIEKGKCIDTSMGLLLKGEHAIVKNLSVQCDAAADPCASECHLVRTAIIVTPAFPCIINTCHVVQHAPQ